MNLTELTREQVLNLPNEVKAKIAYGDYVEPEGPFDAALILGGANFLMKSRAEAGAKLYHAGKTKLLIPTGGVLWNSEFGEMTEAQLLARYLKEFGVPEDKILVEDRATTTHANMKFSYQMLKERYGDKKLRLAIVTSYFHVVRSVKLAYAYIPECEHEGVRAEFPYDNPQMFMKDEEMSKRVTRECGFLWDYASGGLIGDFRLPDVN